MENEGERIAMLEERVKRHDMNWAQNKTDHDKLIYTVGRIEDSILMYKYVVWTAALIIGGIAGFIVKEWNWLTKSLGH